MTSEADTVTRGPACCVRVSRSEEGMVPLPKLRQTSEVLSDEIPSGRNAPEVNGRNCSPCLTEQLQPPTRIAE